MLRDSRAKINEAPTEAGNEIDHLVSGAVDMAHGMDKLNERTVKELYVR